MAYSSFPRIVNPDFSPPEDTMSYQEPFDKNYFGEEYATTPDYALSTFFDTDSFFDRPLSNEDANSTMPNLPQNYPPGQNQPAFSPTLPATGIAATSGQFPPYRAFAPGQPTSYQTTYPLEPMNLETVDTATFSPETYSTSRTPSLCGDFTTAPQRTTISAPPSATSPTFSHSAIKMEPPSTPTSPLTNAPRRTQRKRGRPRLSRSPSASSSQPSASSSSKHARTSTAHSSSNRLPHNQVERKYREGLNAELERLRRAVPTLPQVGDKGEEIGQTKPSKAMVLAGAIEYIHAVERERDGLREEVEMLRGLVGRKS